MNKHVESGAATAVNNEREVEVKNGWTLLVFNLVLLLGAIGLFVFSLVHGIRTTGEPHVALLATV